MKDARIASFKAIHILFVKGGELIQIWVKYRLAERKTGFATQQLIFNSFPLRLSSLHQPLKHHWQLKTLILPQINLIFWTGAFQTTELHHLPRSEYSESQPFFPECILEMLFTYLDRAENENLELQPTTIQPTPNSDSLRALSDLWPDPTILGTCLLPACYHWLIYMYAVFMQSSLFLDYGRRKYLLSFIVDFGNTIHALGVEISIIFRNSLQLSAPTAPEGRTCMTVAFTHCPPIMQVLRNILDFAGVYRNPLLASSALHGQRSFACSLWKHEGIDE